MAATAALQQEEQAIVTTRDTCRMCGNRNLTKVWSFGPTPLANAYLKPEELGAPEPFVALDVYHCEDCHLNQMRDIVSPEVLFARYLYISSTSPKFIAHFEDYARHITERFKLTSESFVIDVGSNDGILLKPFQDQSINILGIDPAENVAEMANAAGIPTRAAFFTPDVAAAVARELGQADIITANNVFAHTDNVDIFIEAVKVLLKPTGAYIFEGQYLGDLVAKNLFDIVYHEHLCYYHVTPLIKFFAKHGMEVFDVERPSVHGGSIRVFVQFAGGPHKKEARLTQILKEEEAAGLNTLKTYQDFAARIEANKQKLLALLGELKKAGKRIVGYGAPAKATTLLYAFGLDGSILDYIVDDDKKIKQGLLMPGNHIPIKSPDMLYQDKPDYCLILAWNFAEPIMLNHKRFREQGGRFIVPIPEPRLI